MKYPVPQSDHDKIRIIQIYRSARIGPRNFVKLIGQSKDYDIAWENLCQAYIEQKIDHKQLCAYDSAKSEYERGLDFGAKFLSQHDPIFPTLLRKTDVAPPFLWAKGNFDVVSRPQIAMVGARNASLDGARMARGMARELSELGFCVVSGLARGIDTSAHEGALHEATIGVIASGLDIYYPKQNQQLQDNISERGLLVSEMPFGHEPQASNFPQRNRIIAGIATATIVIECTRHSGTMITANDANLMGREVLAVPGHPLNPRSEGPNYLIREGASLVRNVEDILEALGRNSEAPQQSATITREPTPGVNWAQMGNDEIEGKTIRELSGELSSTH